MMKVLSVIILGKYVYLFNNRILCPTVNLLYEIPLRSILNNTEGFTNWL